MSDLIVIGGEAPVTLETLDDARLARYFAGKSPETQKAYANDLLHFARKSGHATAADGLRALLRCDRGAAHERVHTYLAGMLEQRRSPAQINRRLTAIRSAVSLARQFGLCDWDLEIRNVSSVPYRDTAGPGLGGVKALLMVARDQDSPEKAARDVLIVRLLFDIALRRAEAARIMLADIDLERRRVAILGKGRLEPEYLSLPAPTCAAITNWLSYRGDAPGPLLLNMDHARKGDHLSGDGIYRIIRRLGAKAGLRVRPHGVRHSAITAALDSTNGNARAVQRFSRHRNIQTLQHYDDNRADMGGEIARSVAALIEGGEE